MAVDLIQISGRTKTAEGESLNKTPYVIIGEGVDIQGQTSDAGTFTETLEGTVDVKSLEITFLPNGDFFQKSITNLVQTSTITDEDKVTGIYNLGNITLTPLVPDFDNFQRIFKLKYKK